jgi:hypothetical protein
LKERVSFVQLSRSFDFSTAKTGRQIWIEKAYVKNIPLRNIDIKKEMSN